MVLKKEFLNIQHIDKFFGVDVEIFLSFIIPAYNASKYIADTLNSIKLEIKNKKNVELIVIDDGSKDETFNIISKFKNKNPDLNVIIHKKENEGVSTARNLGVELARGKYIWFFDSDDIIGDNSIEVICEYLNTEDLDYLSIGVKDFYNEESIESNIENKPDTVVDGLEYIKNYDIEHSPWAFIVKKEIIEKNNIYFLKGVLCEDYDFVLRVIAFSKKINHTKHICYNYIIREGSLSRRRNKEYYIFHHESMIKIIKYITEFFELHSDKEFSNEVKKYLVKIKILALINILNSVLPYSEKKEYLKKFEKVGIFDLSYTGKMNWHFKHKILLLMVKLNILKIICYLKSEKE